jgi:hypothetical protein
MPLRLIRVVLSLSNGDAALPSFQAPARALGTHRAVWRRDGFYPRPGQRPQEANGRTVRDLYAPWPDGYRRSLDRVLTGARRYPRTGHRAALIGRVSKREACRPCRAQERSSGLSALFLLSMRMETQVCVRAARAAARTTRMGRERHVCLSGDLSPKQSFHFRPNPAVRTAVGASIKRSFVSGPVTSALSGKTTRGLRLCTNPFSGKGPV